MLTILDSRQPVGLNSRCIMYIINKGIFYHGMYEQILGQKGKNYNTNNNKLQHFPKFKHLKCNLFVMP